MEYSKDIKTHVNNIKYELNEIQKCIKKQIESDNKYGSVDPLTIRFICLGNVEADCGQINAYCENLVVNVNTAESQDSKLKDNGGSSV